MVITDKFNSYIADARDPFRILDTRAKNALIETMEPEDATLFPLGNVEAALTAMKDLHQRGILYLKWEQQISGKRRFLAVPNQEFSYFTRKLIPVIKKHQVHSNAHGGVEGWSTKRSLETHLPCSSVLSFDLADAFNNVGIRQVFGFFYEIFSELEEEERVECAGFLSQVCTTTYNDQRSLPVGSPHSLAIFNGSLHNLDTSLSSKAEKRQCTYTRWIDDITISSPSIKPPEDFMGAVDLVRETQPIAEKKVFFQTDDRPIYLLGQIIEKGKVFRNSKEKRETNKSPPLDYNKWFKGSRKYEKWE